MIDFYNYHSCMTYKISSMEVRQRLGDLLNRVALRDDEFIIERKGVELAALVPVEKMRQFRKASRLHLLAILNAPSDDKLSTQEADQLADEAKHRTRIKAD
jgi:prevent-host-death family protein